MQVLDDQAIETIARGEYTMDTPSADVLRGRDVICFSNDWSGDPLSKTHLMRLLARDNRVLWVNSIGYRAQIGRAHV